MTDFFVTAAGDESRDAPVMRPETDLGEGNAGRHGSEDYRNGVDVQRGELWIDPVTGLATVLP